MTYNEIIKNKEVLAFLEKGNEILGTLGYNDHSQKHCSIVAIRAGIILEKFGASKKRIELAKVAGFMHDIGNAINRAHHAEYGALLANDILFRADVPLEERIEIVSCIANHDESTGGAFDEVSAALILSDKTDVRRNRVRTADKSHFDIHDRVNYAVTDSNLKIDTDKKEICLNLDIDEKICSMYDYFEIFLGRMMMCRKAAEIFDCKFKLKANGSKVL